MKRRKNIKYLVAYFLILFSITIDTRASFPCPSLSTPYLYDLSLASSFILFCHISRYLNRILSYFFLSPNTTFPTFHSSSFTSSSLPYPTKAFTSSSSSTHDSLKSGPEITLRAICNLFSFASGLLHKSIVLARALLSSEHQVSHHSHSWGRE